MQLEFKGYSPSAKTGEEMCVSHVCYDDVGSIKDAIEKNIPNLAAICASFAYGLMADEKPQVVEIISPRHLAGRYVWVEGKKQDTWAKEARNG